MRHNTSPSNFDPAALPPASDFYNREVGPLRPAGRNRVTANCPFHKSKSGRSFSVDLAKGLWYCHGCGFGGDMVKFIMRRDSCDFKAAAKRLGAWREWLSEAERVQITRGQQARCLQRQLEESIAADDRRERIRLRDELHTAARIYYDLESLLRELGPCEKSEQILETLPEVLDDLRLTESAYCRAAKLEDPNDL